VKLPDTVDDLNALIRNEVQESLHLDLKSAIDNFGSKIWCTSAPNSYRGN